MKTFTITMDTLKAHGIQKLVRVDADYCELVVKGKTNVRQVYKTKSDLSYFYFNDTRYSIANFEEVVPYSTPSNPDTIEKKKSLSEEMKGNNRAAGRKVNSKKEVCEEQQAKIDAMFSNTDTKVRHSQYETIKTCIHNDIPVYLVGEAGTGKNYTLQEIAEDLGLTFYFTNSVQQEYKITGFIDAGGVYHETEFYKAFTQGGLFFLDEIDASIPEVLVLLNAAIANRYFEFPNGRVDAHPSFRVVSAGNTVGSGANELYTGRLVLDSATLDRFVVIEFGYERPIEMSLAKGNEYLVNFIRSLRDFCKTNGIRATFSYRMIINIVKLEAAELPLEQIIRVAVVKGLDKDTIKTLKVNNAGKYHYSLLKVQAAA